MGCSGGGCVGLGVRLWVNRLWKCRGGKCGWVWWCVVDRGM